MGEIRNFPGFTPPSPVNDKANREELLQYVDELRALVDSGEYTAMICMPMIGECGRHVPEVHTKGDMNIADMVLASEMLSLRKTEALLYVITDAT